MVYNFFLFFWIGAHTILETAATFQGLVAVDHALNVPSSTLIFKPKNSLAHLINGTIIPDVQGEYVFSDNQIWRATEFLVGNYDAQQIIVDSFTNGQIENTDTNYNFWTINELGATVHQNNSNLYFVATKPSGQIVLESAPSRAVNFMQQEREISFTSLILKHSNNWANCQMNTTSERLGFFLRSPDNVTNIEFYISSEGCVGLVESVFGIHHRLVVTPLPAFCANQHFSGNLTLDFSGYTLKVECGSRVGLNMSGKHAADMSDIWHGSGDAIVGISYVGSKKVINSKSASLGSFSIRPTLKSDPILEAILSPQVNGISMSNPGLGVQQPLAEIGFLDVTRSPFNADPSGKSDSTQSIQRAIDYAREKYLVVFFPSGKYIVSNTINCIQRRKNFVTSVGQPDCNNMAEKPPNGTRFLSPRCGRTAASVLVGSSKGIRPVIILAKNTGLKGYVVYIHNPKNENVNMNQVFSGIDIRIEDGNPEAGGIYARAAQGTSVQDVKIYAGTASVGLSGGAGSGGSHIDVTVIGGQVGLDLGSSQPSPTISSITLIGQHTSAIVYGKPGRQTLNAVGLNITVAPDATGPAINGFDAISLSDSVIIKLSKGTINPTVQPAIITSGNLFLNNVYFSGFPIIAKFSDGDKSLNGSSNSWVFVESFAKGTTRTDTGVQCPVYLNGNRSLKQFSKIHEKMSPPLDLILKHAWSHPFPSFETKGACNVKSVHYGAKGDLVTDDTSAIQSALDDVKCSTVFLPKGYYAVSKPLQLRKNTQIVGVSRLLTNIVPHSSVPFYSTPKNPAWPLIRTANDANDVTIFAFLSVLIWHHMNSTYAINWQCGRGEWRQAHVNRVDLNPSRIAEIAYYNIPLTRMEGYGGGKLWNFYQENWYQQGPHYRHLLVNHTKQPLNFYHGNLEHSQGEANLELISVESPVRIFGFKGEGNYVQIWAKDCKDLFILGYGGNASPFPYSCPYPPGYAQYPPSIFRMERIERLVIANTITQESKNKKEHRCGLFDTGFAGTFYDIAYWRTILEIQSHNQNFSTPSKDWPVLYIREV